MTTNAWCRILGIETPRLEDVRGHREANTFALLLVALLERGEPMTLGEVAARFAEAGVADEASALRSLQRCRPDRAPVYRDGERYELDPHDQDLDLWAFRLGLRPPRGAGVEVVRPEPTPIPPDDVPLSVPELDEVWKDANLTSNWSAQRVALAVLEAAGGPLAPSEVMAFVSERTPWHLVREDSTTFFQRRGSAITVRDDGRWEIAQNAEEALRGARAKIRERIATLRRAAPNRTSLEELEANRDAYERRRAANAEALAKLRRGLLVSFPPDAPRAVALVDVGAHQIETFVGDELAALPGRLEPFELIGAVGVRPLLRALGFPPGERRLAELGPPQKTIQLSERGRPIALTTELIVRSTCGIARPFTSETKLTAAAVKGADAELRRLLEVNARSLHALYEYGRLHGAVLVRKGSLDERLPVAWVHSDEVQLSRLMDRASAENRPLEAIVGRPPEWSDPWSGSVRLWVEKGEQSWQRWLVDDRGFPIDRETVQRARVEPWTTTGKDGSQGEAREGGDTVHQLLVSLRWVEPTIWRRVLVPSDFFFAALHRILNEAMGWEDTHLHAFTFGDQRIGIPDPDFFEEVLDERHHSLASLGVGKGQRFVYRYDWGDDWEHDVLVEKVLPAPGSERVPTCTAGARSCPPEDVGGPPGYFEFVAAIRDPNHPEHRTMREWLGGTFDPEGFDLGAANERLARIR